MNNQEPSRQTSDAKPRSIHEVLCRRCGKLFTPKPTKLKTIPMTRCCESCAMRNLFDDLDMRTPPAANNP